MSDQNASEDLPAEEEVDVMSADEANPAVPTSDSTIAKAEEQAVEEQAVEEQAVEEQAVEEQAVEEQAVEEQAVEPSETVEAGTLEAEPEEAAEPEETAENDVEEPAGPVEPVEVADESDDDQVQMQWYILKVQVNREDYIRDALARRVKIAGLEEFFGDIVVPTEDVAEFNRSGKRRVVKRKLYPGYIMANMIINDDTWFLVRETPGIGDFTGSAGKPTPMPASEVERIIFAPSDEGEDEPRPRMRIPFSEGNRVRVKDGYFQNFEGDVESIDEATGRVTVIINIFGRSTPVELQHYQIEKV